MPSASIAAQFDFADSKRAELFLALAQRLEFPLSSQHKILDFGCGRGQNVYHLRRLGLRAYGVDVDQRATEGESWCSKLTSEPLFKQAQLSPYKLPYEDGAFDFIFSAHVFEHVMDYNAVMREVARVLAPGGLSLHIFPARLRLLESHLKVPFGGCIRSRAWFTFWAALGIGRAWHGSQLSATEIGQRNFDWTHSRVNYLSRQEIAEYARPYFSNCDFIEHQAIKERLGIQIPGLASLVGTFHIRVMVLKDAVQEKRTPRMPLASVGV